MFWSVGESQESRPFIWSWLIFSASVYEMKSVRSSMISEPARNSSSSSKVLSGLVGERILFRNSVSLASLSLSALLYWYRSAPASPSPSWAWPGRRRSTRWRRSRCTAAGCRTSRRRRASRPRSGPSWTAGPCTASRTWPWTCPGRPRWTSGWSFCLKGELPPDAHSPRVLVEVLEPHYHYYYSKYYKLIVFNKSNNISLLIFFHYEFNN